MAQTSGSTLSIRSLIDFGSEKTYRAWLDKAEGTARRGARKAEVLAMPKAKEVKRSFMLTV
jgi:hypothetical protein